MVKRLVDNYKRDQDMSDKAREEEIREALTFMKI